MMYRAITKKQTLEAMESNSKDVDRKEGQRHSKTRSLVEEEETKKCINKENQ